MKEVEFLICPYCNARLEKDDFLRLMHPRRVIIGCPNCSKILSVSKDNL